MEESPVAAAESGRANDCSSAVNSSITIDSEADKVAQPTKNRPRDQSNGGAPMRLVPIVRTTRDKIPLAWLDTNHVFDNINNSSHGGRIFTNYSDALADWFRGGDKVSKMVQIVREKSSGRLCAVERVRYGDYAICAIGSWVSEESIIGKPPVLQKQGTKATGTQVAPTILDVRKRKKADLLDAWWEKPTSKNSQVSPTPPIVATSAEDPTTTTNVSLVVSQPQDGAEAAKLQVNQAGTPSRTLDLLETVLDPFQVSPAAQSSSNTPETIFERFLTQYLDALYLQRTSLAFFAKGPLARIRTAFTTNKDETVEALSATTLSSLLRDIVLNLNVMEKKYKEKLPAITNDTVIAGSDNESEVLKTKKKKKKPKLKPNKQGLHDGEEACVRKWWRTGDTDMPSSAETREQQVKRRLELLRVRETLLQIVIVLEVLSLEKSNDWKENSAKAEVESLAVDPTEIVKPTNDKMNTHENELSKNSHSKKKRSRRQDLPIHLDLLVDRIAIWHSLKHESEFLPATASKNKEQHWSLDLLGAFCTDVVVPFFNHRMPDQVSALVKKFGGPGNSPEKTRIAPQTSTSKSKSKAEKPVNAKPVADKPSQRRVLNRTPTESDATRPVKRAPGLVRASTDTSLLLRTDVKRESSEGPLSAIPLLREKKQPRRDSAEKLRLLQKRTVSFSALSNSKKRKAAAEEEVRAAIESIKRPNRGEVGRQVADERDRRVSAGTKHPGQRKVLNSRPNVQVAATPKHNRKINVVSDDVSISQPLSMLEEPPSVPSTGNASRILDTVQQHKVHDAIGETPSVNRIKKLDLVPGSHSRTKSGPLNFNMAATQPAGSFVDIAPAGRDTIFATPVRPQRTFSLDTSSVPIAKLTPRRSSATSTTQPDAHRQQQQQEPLREQIPQVSSVPRTPQKDGFAASNDIYATLGWDEYDDDN